MADFMKDSFKYSDLANKYGNFRVPAVKVKIQGSDPFEATNTYMGDLSLSLSLSAANSANFKIMNAYDKKYRSYRSNVKTTFCLGQIIQIELGYLSATALVFKGFITAVDVEFSTEPEIKITALDVRRLMMIETHERTFLSGKKYSDIFKTVMSPYGELCSLQVEDTAEVLEKPVSQKNSDYDFVYHEMIKKKKLDREFFVFGDKAYFRKPRSVSTPVLSFEWGENLISFTRRSCYLNLKVTVCGYDNVEQEAFLAESEIKNGDKQNDPLSNQQNLYVADVGAGNNEQAEKNAAEIANEKKKKAQQGSGTCIGLPEIVPGRFIKIDKLDDGINANYYIVSVNHSFGSGGFQTSFEIGGWA